MTLGNKLSRLRKENNYTQEQLAEILGVSRQSISKWESDISYPETDKLIHLSNLFGCSLDYLLKDTVESNDYGKKSGFDYVDSDYAKSGSKYSDSDYTNSDSNYSDAYSNAYYANTNYSDSDYSYGKSKKYSQLDVLDSGLNIVKEHLRERKSKKTFCGLPLWHIGRNAKGIIAIGLNAKGFLAIGMKATGVISLGMLSIGIISLGMLSISLIALGMMSLGVLAVGCFTIGIFSVGAISVGIIAIGGVSVGKFAVGGAAIGKYLAYGGDAKAMIAIGNTKATGSVFEKIGSLSKEEVANVKHLLDVNVPGYLAWAKNIVKAFL
ncbi:MAG: helix-turn-helix domain-containing protein [Clostridiales bacterium]|nr:helix-turn-helix domain-containing protein [Clostridiales bacterium]MDD6293053.1 helix-turn-helix domain-containing protein [Eubacteriales bacterium]